MSTQVDLTKLPAPQIIEEPEFEKILEQMRADLHRRAPGFTAGQLESDPAVKLLEALAYREMLLRARINRAARAVMLAHASRLRPRQHRGSLRRQASGRGRRRPGGTASSPARL